MPDGPAFERILGSALYAMPRWGEDRGWCGYVLGRADPQFGDELEIGIALDQRSGHYIFAQSAPPLTTREAADAFVAAVRAYADSSFGGGGEFAGRAMVFVDDPVVPAFGPPGERALSFGDGPSGLAIQTGVRFPLGEGLAFELSAGLRIGRVYQGLRFEPAPDGRAAFVGAGESALPAVQAGIAHMPLIGAYSGCFTAYAEIGQATLDHFGAGIRYVHGGASTGPVAQVYPLVSLGEKRITCAVAIDPLDPTNDGPLAERARGRLRTLLAPREPMPELTSGLRTAAGRPVKLRPAGDPPSDIAEPARFAGAFAFEQADGASGGALPMTLAGDWALGTDGGGEVHDLLCGLSGLERIRFPARDEWGASSRLRLVPGRPAYAPRFPFAEASIEHPAEAAKPLDDGARTAWATVLAADGTPGDYIAQPEGGALHRFVGDADVPVLDWYPTPRPLPAHEGFAVPLAPYGLLQAGGGGFGPGELSRFETEVLAAERGGRLRAEALPGMRAARSEAPADVNAERVRALTPKGSIVELEGARYVKLALARSDDGSELAFENLTPELQSVFELNQLFAVIVNPAHVGDFHNTVSMSGWTLAANIGRGSTATDYRNVVLLKFCEGSVAEWIGNPEKWSAASELSLLPDGGASEATLLSGLSQWLRGQVARARAEQEAGNPVFDDFLQLVDDPGWNGLLVLSGDVTAMPPQLAGVLGGVDPGSMSAHHFGVSVAGLRLSGGFPRLGQSSIFGLVDYELPRYRAGVAAGAPPDAPLGLPLDGAFGFDVLQLQIVFRNSAIADFRSRAQLGVGELFGARVERAYVGGVPAPAPAVVLRGRYQAQGAGVTYVFEPSAPTTFVLAGHELRAVAFDRVQLNTISAEPDSATLASRFLVWGKLDFEPLADAVGAAFDVLSFGSDPGAPPERLGRSGLAFSNLVIDMTAPAATPTATSFTLDASRLAFDAAASAARPGSVVAGLALAIDCFVAAPAGKRPADYGYLPVSMSLPLAPLDGPWFGIACKLDLGTPGALVSRAGFDSRMLLAWAPQADHTAGHPAACAIALPGAAPGAKLMSIQGVLKLGVDSVELTREAVRGHPDRRAFALRLRNIGLRIFGVAKLPPGATIDCYLFGALEPGAGLGWYAAYRKGARDAVELERVAP